MLGPIHYLSRINSSHNNTDIEITKPITPATTSRLTSIPNRREAFDKSLPLDTGEWGTCQTDSCPKVSAQKTRVSLSPFQFDNEDGTAGFVVFDPDVPIVPIDECSHEVQTETCPFAIETFLTLIEY